MQVLALQTFGLLLTAFVWMRYSTLYGALSLAAVGLLTHAWYLRKRRRIMQDPEKRKAFQEKREQLERRFGVPLAYNAKISNGLRAEATIVRIAAMEAYEDNNPTLECHLEVTGTFDPPTRAVVKARFPRVLLPQFQPGKIVVVEVDPQDATRISFHSYMGENGESIYFADYPA